VLVHRDWFHCYLVLVQDDRSRVNTDNILEERDPKFDAMLGQMVGRIKSKPGGKPEMGEVSLWNIVSTRCVELKLTQKCHYDVCINV